MRQPNKDDIAKDGKVNGGWRGIETWYFPPVSIALNDHPDGGYLRIITDGPGVYHETRLSIESVKDFLKNCGEI